MTTAMGMGHNTQQTHLFTHAQGYEDNTQDFNF